MHLSRCRALVRDDARLSIHIFQLFAIHMSVWKYRQSPPPKGAKYTASALLLAEAVAIQKSALANNVLPLYPSPSVRKLNDNHVPGKKVVRDSCQAVCIQRVRFFSKAARRKTETRVWHGRIMAATPYGCLPMHLDVNSNVVSGRSMQIHSGKLHDQNLA